MNRLYLHLTLLSDATFGRGDGVAGLIDTETEYDPETGIPFLRGRALKGLLNEACSDLLFALSKSPAESCLTTLEKAAQQLFGVGGSRLEDQGKMSVGAATLMDTLCNTIRADIRSKTPLYRPEEVLESLTGIRRQTALDETGAPETGSLRGQRVILRNTKLIAPLDFAIPVSASDDAIALLTACVCALHRAGTARNRGRGRLRTELCDTNHKPLTEVGLQRFRQIVEEAKSA